MRLYDVLGREIARRLPNTVTTYHNYDAASQVTSLIHRGSSSVLQSLYYTYDADGQRTKIEREDNTRIYYSYDAAHRLTGEDWLDPGNVHLYAFAYNYDAAGNRTRQTCNSATTYYQYDRCGNTTVQQAPGGTTYYHWDHENLLKQLDLPGGVHNSFSYDADSKRVTKQDSEGFTRFLYQGPDMLKLLQERDTNGGLVAHYTMGNGLEAMRRGSASHFYHYDWLGSTFELTDASGVVTDDYLYNAWGECLFHLGVATNPYWYVGRERYRYEERIQLHLLGQRYYASPKALFVTADPLRDHVHRYIYCEQRPSVLVDPAGTAPCDKVYFWHSAGWPININTQIEKSRAKLKSKSCDTRRFWIGSGANLDTIANDPKTAGFVVVGHGGCGKTRRNGKWYYMVYAAQQSGTDYARVGYRNAEVPVSGSYQIPWRPIVSRNFVVGLFVHCYVGPGSGSGGCAENMEALAWYASTLRVPRGTLHAPHLDKEGQVFERDVQRAINAFPDYFGPGCKRR